MQHTQRKHRRASLNHNFRLVWSEAQQMFVAVAEICRGQGKAKSTVAAAVAALLLSTGAAHAQALPTGGQVTAGQASINTNGAVMNIDQSSNRAAINWNTFNIGAGGTVNFNQPSPSAVTLNRVVGNERSVIDGALNANGSVWILNSQGVLFNRSAQVNVGSLVATTLNMSDEAFMAGSTTFEGNGGPGSIINLGTLSAASEGHIALLGQHVVNEGVIHATLGSAILAAGDKVSLNFNGNSLVGVTIERGVLNALVENKQAIIADGGLVTLTAKGLDEVMRTVVNNTGEVRAQTIEQREGRIFLLGGMENDRIEVSGRLDASAPNGGNGGFIETSAANVQIREGLAVTTRAAQGKTGQWLIDPTDIFIVDDVNAGSVSGNPATNDNTGDPASSNIYAGAINTALENTDVTITTASNGNGAGDIHVNANLTWDSGTTLTLRADRNININAILDARDTGEGDSGKVVLEYAQGAAGVGNYTFAQSNGVFSGRILLDDGQFFSTKRGSDATIDYTVVSDANGLQGINANLNGNYALGITVNMPPSSDPIGNSSTPFTGKFIGLGNTINNLTISKPGDENVGLFGVTDGATISNVALTNASVNGYDSVGTLIGRAKATLIDNVHAHDVAVGNLSVGGLIGTLEDNSILRHSSAAVNVTGVRPAESTQSVAYIGGLVGYLDDSTIEDSRATGRVRVVGDAGDEVGSIGGLVGEADGSTILRSTASGNVEGGFDDENIPIGEHVGGLVGFANEDLIEDSSASGSVQGYKAVGGLVGNLNYFSSITGSHATGRVEGAEQVGGLIGYLGVETSITNSYSNSVVEGESSVGGLVGFSDGNSSEPNTITGSHHKTGTVTGVFDVGGLVGKARDTIITNAYATSNVTATGFDDGEGLLYSRVGGLVGEMRGGSITGSRAEGNVVGTFEVGGLVGELRNDGQIANSHATGNVDGYWNVGGLAGRNQSGSSITRSYATGDVTGVGDNRKQIGGLVGGNAGDILESYAEGAVTGAEDVGGLVGGMSGGMIERSFATGIVTGVVSANYTNTRIGGLVGLNYDGAIVDSFASGAVSGVTKVGGLVGWNYGNGAVSSITNSYSTGLVTGTTDVGGLVGDNTLGLIYDSFWDTETSGQSSGVGFEGTANFVTGKTTAEMKALATYPLGDGEEVMGWDIVGDSSLSNVYPQLRWRTSGLTGSPVWVIAQPTVTSVMFTLDNKTGTYDGTNQLLSSFWDSPSLIFVGCVTCADWVLGTDYTFQQNGSTVTGFRNAGTYGNISVNILASGFGVASTGNTLGSLTINQRPVNISVSKQFDGTQNFTTGFNLSNIVQGDVVTVTSGTVSVSGLNSGSYNIFTSNTLELSNANYVLTGGAVSAVINPRILTITGTNVADKVFDGNTVATVAPGTLGNVVAGHPVSVAATGLFNNANAGTRRSVRVTYTLDNDNYLLADEVLFANIEQSQTLLNQIAASRNVTQPSDGPGQIGSGQFGTLLPPTFSVAAGQGPVSGADGQQTPGNVIVATPSLTLPFTNPGELMMVGTPNPGDPANVVSLSEARQMMGDGQTEGEREIRVPVSRNSLAEIVNGGVRLPGGVEQKLFVVRK